MFNRGLISIADDRQLLLAKGRVPDSVGRLLNPNRVLLAPTRADQAPHPLFLRWHRQNVFKGEPSRSSLSARAASLQSVGPKRIIS
jgi:putative restriction endonuclease